MAAPAPPPVPDLTFVLEGDPDLGDAASVALLPPDPWVVANKLSFQFRAATPFLPWEDLPAAVVGESARSRLPLSVVDLVALYAARPSQWLRGSPVGLLVSVRPGWFTLALRILETVGGLDLSIKYASLGDFLSAVAKAASEACDNPALELLEAGCFLGQPPGNSGFSHTAAVRFVWKLSAEMLVQRNDCAALGLLKWAVRPYLVRAERDTQGSNFFKVLESVRRITSTRSDALKLIVDAPDVESSDEVAEAIVDSWMLLARGADWLDFHPRSGKRTLELDLAARLILGSASSRSSAFRELFPRLLRKAPVIKTMVQVKDSPWADGEMLQNWEQLATIVMPNMSWDSIAAFEAVSSELMCMQALVEELADFLPAERLVSLRKHLKLVSSFEKSSKPSGGSAGASEEDGFSGPSGLAAIRSVSFLKAREHIKQLLLEPDVSFMQVLEALLGSGDKVFYMVAVRKLGKASLYEEISDCTPFLGHFGKFWAMSAGQGPGGVIQSSLQGKAFDEEAVTQLLDGQWHKIPWIRLAQELDLWTDNIAPVESAFILDPRFLKEVDKLIVSTLAILNVEHPQLPGSLLPSSHYRSLMDRLLLQAKRCLAFEVGSKLRGDQEMNWVGAFTVMLKEAGERWVGQFSKPTNLAVPLVSGFLSPSSFLLNSLDRIAQIGAHLSEYAGVLPSLLPASQIRPLECSALIAGVGEVSAEVNRLLSPSPSSVPLLALAPPLQRSNPPVRPPGEEPLLAIEDVSNSTKAKRARQREKRGKERRELAELRKLAPAPASNKKKRKNKEEEGVKKKKKPAGKKGE
jgi:hypothetical protein